ncbi:hypothetical protein F2Q70_00030052 [Brassica cretica]|uniref:Uncharacterized protein n=2 Tax=Brassica cretica TaxID=69181 RepID=A0A3N6QH14_BRACR|nr:hypothetical protein F2Q70_00030052 [Brassica cretica]KAF2554073.1 hypothetical protein F2Q68_00034530 [Brassica cretica]KAF3488041.1 hypothetical protein F2Q69_00053317 [Brassica cretica]KAF3592491.1 hypothetical protein DY000_02022360 [Brassica cretica]
MEKLWSSDGVLETAEPRALMFPEEEEGFLFIFCKDQISFLLLTFYVRDSSEYLETSLFPFLVPEMNPELLVFPSSRVGGRPRPRRNFIDPFSSPVPTWGDALEADSEVAPMAPLRRHYSCFFDDGPRSEIREGDLTNMRRRYTIHPSVGMRSPTEFERAPDGGAGEVAVYEAYLEAGFRGVIPSLIGEI